MNHSFDTEVAKKIGIEESIILQHLYYWCNKNRINDKNFYDNNYWTYNTNKAFCEIFSYMKESTVRRCIKKLIDEGYVITGNYNELKFDRTLWYAITEKTLCIFKIVDFHLLKTTNASEENNNTIPNTNTDINTDIEKTSLLKKEVKKISDLYPCLTSELFSVESKKFDTVDKKLGELVFPFDDEKFIVIFFAKCLTPLFNKHTSQQLQSILKKISIYPLEFAIEIVETSFANNWRGIVFPDTPKHFEKWKQGKQNIPIPFESIAEKAQVMNINSSLYE